MIKRAKYVYCISNCYLKALLRESKEYSFDAKLYYSCQEGLKNLVNTNASEIIGYVILLDKLPDDEDELLALIDFINAINEISDNTPLVLALSNSEGYEQLGEYVSSDNLKVFLIDGFEMLTDVDIKRDIYGSIVKYLYNPYCDNNDTVLVNYNDEPSCIIEPIYRSAIQSLCDPVINAPTLRDALENDETLMNIDKADEVARFLRTLEIKLKYNSSDNDYYTQFENLIKTVKSGEDVIIINSLYNLIIGGVIPYDRRTIETG